MELWLALAVLTAAVLIAVLRPLLRPAGGLSATAAQADVAVYRDQLAELETDRARGLIGETEAAAAKTEIARRLLASADAARTGDAPTSPLHPDSSPRAAAIALAVIAPLLAVALYLFLGAPNIPGQPLSARAPSPADSAGLSQLIAKVESRLREHPEDGTGWDVIAPVYLKQGRYADAANAYNKASALLGESPRRLAGFAEATVMARDGIVTEPARLAYEQLARLEPKRPEPRFWLALAKEQNGEFAEAAAAYEALLAEIDESTPWRAVVSERLAGVRTKLAPPEAGKVPAERGPTADDVAAASSMAPEARAQFIDQMVSGLAARLKQNGNDLAGWQRLIRAYVVLGRSNDAATALTDARQHFSAEPESLARLDALARNLGIGS
jgi:cytochrome c-type biogenesis protein CcmH